MFDQDKFKFEDITAKSVDVGASKDVQQDYRFDIVIPSHCKVSSAPESSSAQSTCLITITTVAQSQQQTTDHTCGQTTDQTCGPTTSQISYQSTNHFTISSDPLGPILPLPFQITVDHNTMAT